MDQDPPPNNNDNDNNLEMLIEGNIGIDMRPPLTSIRMIRPSFLLNTSLFDRGDLVNIVTESLEENKEFPKPMCKKFIESLEQIKIKGDDDLSCAICQDKFKEGENVIQLPCKDGKHFFHFEEGECPGLKPWIEINNTCPVCRTAFPLEPESEPESEPEPESEQGSISGINSTEIRRELAENIMEETFTNIMRSYIDSAFEELEDRELNEAIQRSLDDI